MVPRPDQLEARRDVDIFLPTMVEVERRSSTLSLSLVHTFHATVAILRILSPSSLR